MDTRQDKEIMKIIDDYPQLEDKHIELAKIAMLPKALRPSRHKTRARLDISDSAYYYWMRHPAVLKVKRILTKRYFQDDIPDIVQALRDEAVSGNERAAKVFLEYVDEWEKVDDNKPVVQVLNIEQVNILLDKFRQKKL